MTTIAYSPTRPGLFAETERVVQSLLTRFGDALVARRGYCRTLAELNALTMRQREDIGIVGHDARDVARAASRLA